jgi:hypothetical protein
MLPDQMMTLAEGHGVIPNPTDWLIAARKDVSALESFGRSTYETFAVSGSNDLVKEFVQTGDTDFQSFLLFYYLIVI